MTWTQVGERIVKIRKDRRLSQAQFGQMIGISGQYIGMVEKGAHGLSVESIVKICDATGFSADYILFGTIAPVQYSDTITALYGLSHEQIQIVLDIVKKVAQLINTEDGNEALIQEVVSQQHTIIY